MRTGDVEPTGTQSSVHGAICPVLVEENIASVVVRLVSKTMVCTADLPSLQSEPLLGRLPHVQTPIDLTGDDVDLTRDEKTCRLG